MVTKEQLKKQLDLIEDVIAKGNARKVLAPPIFHSAKFIYKTFLLDGKTDDGTPLLWENGEKVDFNTKEGIIKFYSIVAFESLLSKDRGEEAEHTLKAHACDVITAYLYDELLLDDNQELNKNFFKAVEKYDHLITQKATKYMPKNIIPLEYGGYYQTPTSDYQTPLPASAIIVIILIGVAVVPIIGLIVYALSGYSLYK